ncbi:Hsp33 family molecular chaperone HslO [Sandaracinus amylolyticus]|uniref:33 kDa chaperonin n=1 Tax=Sandaracinus amylolyticus TaxID=927083 RepID=A0A0F6SI14_9BACT|nr:Hsp33 family molecular chaperone HslO [Sandaracinus amylolyticus]AKF11399.1 33 kDa chaperonin [Sandaracinus amylolyticus]
MLETDAHLSGGDRAVTTITEDGSFRVVTLRSTQTVTAAIAAQNATGTTAEHLADLITGSVLVRLTMAPDLRVQGVVRGKTGKGTLVADCHPDGGCRALVRETAGPIEIGPGSLVQVMRSLPNGTSHQGVVEIPADYGISGAFMVYMLESEQVTSVIGVGCVMSEDDKVSVAGGWIVQLLPECKEPPLELMYQRMRLDFADPKSVLRSLGGDPETLQSEILYGMPYQQTGGALIEHRCYCSPERVFASMATLGRADLEDILRKGETLHVSCDYCNRPYEVHPETLRGLLEAS